MKNAAHRDREVRLRTLCFWYELNGQPQVAEALQDAADAMAEGALSQKAADALIDVWRPHVRIEAIIGDAPAAIDTLEAVRYAVTDLHRILMEAPDAQKPMIAAKLREQVAIHESLEKGTP